jgi:hypothetical protein
MESRPQDATRLGATKTNKFVAAPKGSQDFDEGAAFDGASGPVRPMSVPRTTATARSWASATAVLVQAADLDVLDRLGRSCSVRRDRQQAHTEGVEIRWPPSRRTFASSRQTVGTG